MRLKQIAARDIQPVRKFDVDDLSDVVVLAGPNGVGKTRLVERLLEYFQSPSPRGNLKLIVEATNDTERSRWGKSTLDTSVEVDCTTLKGTLQQNRSRTRWISSVINFESDRTIQQITPFTFGWDFKDPWEEQISWGVGFGGLRSRFQDTLHALFRKVRTRREEIAKKAELLMKEKAGQDRGAAASDEHFIRLDPSEFPDPIDPFRRAFSQLLAPKELIQPDPRNQQLQYSYDGNTFSIASLSSGEREVVNIVFDFLLRNPSDSIVVFDEPELHLHPELSYKLLQTLRTIGANNQFIFCTHSPDIITASLDSSVVFIAPPKDAETNQTILVREDDETHRALKLLGQSIGIIALGKKIVLVEGTHSSLDKQTYGSILKARFPNLVLVPGGGKGVVTSFSMLHREILERTIWGVEFYMLCDRDAVPRSRTDTDIESAAAGRLKVLKRYHLENYFLDERVLASVFAHMEPAESWLASAVEIRARLKESARTLVSYAAALTTSACFREHVGNLDIMVKDCHGKTVEELVTAILTRTSSERSRIEAAIDQGSIEAYVRDTVSDLERSLDEDTEDWKRLMPGKPLLNRFASQARLDVGRLKILYLREAENHQPYPFQDIVEIFDGFNRL